MLKRFWFWFALVLSIVAAVGTSVFIKLRQTANAVPTKVGAIVPSLELLPSDLLTVAPRDLRQTLSVLGSLRAVNQASVKARVAGEVTQVLAREGESVALNQVLVRMDQSEYRARLVQSEGVLAAARSQLDIAAKARDNNRALLERGFISKNAFDTTSSQYDIARANLSSAQGALDITRKALSDTVIRAPIAGLVASRSVQQGEKVSVDAKLLDVVDLSKMEMEVAVPTSDILKIVPGQDVILRLEGLADSLPARVARINPTTQAGSRSILIYLQLDNPQGLLRSGMFGEARLTLAKKAGVLAVPQSALQRNGETSFVYAIENGRLVRQAVQTGIVGSDGDAPMVEITSGLMRDARIVRGNLGNLPAGTTVRIVQGVPALIDAASR